VDKKNKYNLLTYREKHVFKLIALGFSGKEIAEKLCLSTSTIDTYRTRILAKMKFKNNAELIRYAIKQKMVD